MDYTIRKLREDEREILEDLLYEAIFQPAGGERISRDIIKQPQLFKYIRDFGRSGDRCLVAEADRRIIGGVWVRKWSGTDKGYGYIDDSTPEFSISLLKGYRGRGVGSALMREMISLLKGDGCTQASLSVSRDNYAVGLYRKLGFKVVAEGEDDHVMLLNLRQ